MSLANSARFVSRPLVCAALAACCAAAWASAPDAPTTSAEGVGLSKPEPDAGRADPAHLLLGADESIVSVSLAEAPGKLPTSAPNSVPAPPLPPVSPIFHGWAGAPGVVQMPREVSISVGGMPLSMLAPLSQRVVEGAAFCADAITESIKPLTDGNRIVQRSTARMCRDAQGRTRQEVGEGSKRRTYIHDPVAKQLWSIDAAQKTFQRMNVSLDGGQRNTLSLTARLRPQGEGQAAANAALGAVEAAEVELGVAERARESAQRVAERAREIAGRIRESVTTGTWREERVMSSSQLQSSGGKNHVIVHMAPVSTTSYAWSSSAPLEYASMRFVSAPRGAPVASALPSREIEGIRANGELSTWTIEAGKVGNEKPIRITREVWTSPELMLTLMSKDIDPREGEHHYRLSNVSRQAPDPELFKVPADFAERKP